MAIGKRSTQQSASRPQGGHQASAVVKRARTNVKWLRSMGGVTVESVSSKLPFFLDRLTPFVGKGGVAAWPWPPDAAALSSLSGGLSAMISPSAMPVTLLNQPHLRLSPDSRSGSLNGTSPTSTPPVWPTDNVQDWCSSHALPACARRHLGQLKHPRPSRALCAG
jgi:hypothetical protein